MTRPPRMPGRRTYLLVILFALVLVVLPFWFWYDTWFGRRLSDSAIEEYLSSADRPRRIQQALVQIGERLSHGDKTPRKWYPSVTDLAGHPNPELRQTVAWIMGQDRTHEPFRAVLRKLLADPVAMVRRNSAINLAAFGDDSGRGELRAMLSPATVNAPKSGRVVFRLQPGDYANPGTLLARIDEMELRSPLPGEVREWAVRNEAAVNKDQPLLTLGVDEQHAWEALRALFLVGNREDLDDVRRHMRSPNAKLAQQAQATVRQIESR